MLIMHAFPGRCGCALVFAVSYVSQLGKSCAWCVWRVRVQGGWCRAEHAARPPYAVNIRHIGTMLIS